jgi:hypothetical protein
MTSPEAPGARIAAAVAQQRAMNAETWKALMGLGIGEGTPLRLDFLFDAPDHPSAQALADHFTQSYDYWAEPRTERRLFRRRWVVFGRTTPVPVSQDFLDEWVETMIRAGVEHGGCDFDGWGTEASA